MRIHDLIKEEKQPEIKLTQVQIYEKKLKEELKKHHEDDRRKNVTK